MNAPDVEENINEFSNSLLTLISDLNSTCDGRLSHIAGIETLSHDRTLPNVLTRIKYIIDQRAHTSKQFKDTDFKHFWLPDHLSKGCYDCSDKFTTLKRRHHCRVCGQIFCSKCCNKIISGKNIGYKGDLKVCMYCYKVVLTYILSSNDDNGTFADLESIRQSSNFKVKDSFSSSGSVNGHTNFLNERKNSRFKFMEESYSNSLSASTSSKYQLISPSGSLKKENCDKKTWEQHLLLKDNNHMQMLLNRMLRDPTLISSNRHRLKVYSNTFVGKDFVQWILSNDIASNAKSAVAIGQILLDSNLILCVSQPQQDFMNEYVLYILAKNNCKTEQSSAVNESNMAEREEEPLWFQQIDCFDDEEVADLSESENELVSSSLKPPEEIFNSMTDQNLEATNRQNLSSSVMNDEVLQAIKTLEPKAEVDQNIIDDVDSTFNEHTKLTNIFKFNLSDIWKNYETALLIQLLKSSNLNVDWGESISKFSQDIVQLVKPDVKNDSDLMDIRQYVHFKKVPNGSKADICIINGVVCTKNVCHKNMKTTITNPQILILGTHIDFYRSKKAPEAFSSQNVVALEEKFVREMVDKIKQLKPDVLIAGQGISFLARKYLMEEGIALIMNVKASVLIRISRCTQAKVFNSLEEFLVNTESNPLGMCHSFYLKDFFIPNCEKKKVLMFFDGCPTHLCCTIMLHGANNSVLSRVKRVIYFYIYVLYNWKLEKSFLTDIFADIPFIGKNFILKEGRVWADSWVKENEHSSDILLGQSDCAFKERNVIENNKTEQELENRTFIKLSDINAYNEDKMQLKDDCNKADVPSENQPFSLEFEKFLNYTILSISPYIKYSSLPYMLNEGNKSYLRKFFPEKLYFSILFQSKNDNENYFFKSQNVDVVNTVSFNKESVISERNNISLQLDNQTSEPNSTILNNTVKNTKQSNPNLNHLPLHSFVTMKITKSIQDPEMLNALADFRARGCTIRNICDCEKDDFDPTSMLECIDRSKLSPRKEFRSSTKMKQDKCDILTNSSQVQNETCYFSTNLLEKQNYNGFILTPQGKLDALHPYNHQRITLLFYSYSHTFQFTSNFCIKPRVLTRDFYGLNDIPLGVFLESYCFNSAYKCGSATCNTTTEKHLRQFVHETGCVEVLVRKLENCLDDENAHDIYMWTWCAICRKVSPVIPMSNDTWNFSFAKYLELRFRDDTTKRRGAPSSCDHSIHKEHVHYFGQRDFVAILKHSTIPIRELIIPPSFIFYNEENRPVDNLKELKKCVALSYKIFSTILNHLLAIANGSGQNCYPLLDAVSNQHIAQKENCKLILDTCKNSPHDAADKIVSLKRLLLQVVLDWNNKVPELLSLRKKDEKERSKAGNFNRVLSNISSKNTTEEDFSKICSMSSNNENNASQFTGLLSVNHPIGSGAILEDLNNTKSIEKGSFKIADDQKNRADTVVGKGVFTLGSGPMSVVLTEKSSIDSTIDALEASESVFYTSSPIIKRRSVANPINKPKSVANPINKHTSLANPINKPKSVANPINKPKSVANPINKLKSVANPINKHTSVANPINKPQSVANPINMLSPSSIATDPFLQTNSQVKSQISYDSTIDVKTGASEVKTEVPSSVKIEAPASTKRIRRLPSFSNVDEYSLEDIVHCLETIDSPLRGFKSFLIPQCSIEQSTSDDGDVPSLIIGEKSEKKGSVMNLFSNFLSPSIDFTINTPFPPSDHLEFSSFPECKIPIVIYDNEPSSIIAKALASQEYQNQLTKFISNSDSKCSSPSKNTVENSDHVDPHVDLQWSDQHAKYYCKILFVEKFHKLRTMMFPYGEETFIKSLSRCVLWEARGGKSGSFFCKTMDDRFILKGMSRFEISSFLEFAPNYVRYLTKCKKTKFSPMWKKHSSLQGELRYYQNSFWYPTRGMEDSQPTALTRIVGVFKIGFKNQTTNKALKLDLLVMENLFYDRVIGHKFDLKGSVSNRKVTVTGNECDVVLMDENLLQMVCSSPFYLRPPAKTVLTRAISADTAFLSHQLVMDYSLLVGVDEIRNELVIGIIDYIRTFTWDKRLETMVKGSVLSAGSGKLPTVISPENYRNRFCHAMENYFVLAPDKWTGLSFDA